MYKKICYFCQDFRIDELKINQKNFCAKYGLNVKSLSSFENGKANNINYLQYYYLECKTEEQRIKFAKGVFENGINN